jgi:hypothetical protein
MAARPTSQRPVLMCAVDNTPALAWSQRGSTSSIAPAAFLLRHHAQNCCIRDFSLHPVYTPGASNKIADFSSRFFCPL